MNSLPVKLIYGQKAVSDRIKLNRFALPTTKITEDEKDRKVLKSETCKLRTSLCNQAFTNELTRIVN